MDLNYKSKTIWLLKKPISSKVIDKIDKFLSVKNKTKNIKMYKFMVSVTSKEVKVYWLKSAIDKSTVDDYVEHILEILKREK